MTKMVYMDSIYLSQQLLNVPKVLLNKDSTAKRLQQVKDIEGHSR